MSDVNPSQDSTQNSSPEQPPADGPQHRADPSGAEHGATRADQAQPPAHREAPAGTEPADPEPELDEEVDDSPIPAAVFDVRAEQPRAAGIRAAQKELAAGEVVVMPTDTVYGIAANAFSAEGVQRLLDAKGRGRNMPPPVLIGHAGVLDGLADSVSDEARALAQAFWPGGLTIICHAQPSLRWDLGDTHGTVALRVPDDEIAVALLNETGPLAVSSANRTGMEAAATAAQAQEMLGDSVRVYLEAGPRSEGRDPAGGAGPSQPSTIVDCTGTTPIVVRQGRISLTRLRQVVPAMLSITGESDLAGPSASGAGDDTAEPAGASGSAGTSPAAQSAPDDAGETPASGGATAAGAAADGEPRPSGRRAADVPVDGVPGQRQSGPDQRRSVAPAEPLPRISGTVTGTAAAAAIVGASGSAGAAADQARPDQERRRPVSAESEQPGRPLSRTRASQLVAYGAQDADDDHLAESSADQRRG